MNDKNRPEKSLRSHEMDELLEAIWTQKETGKETSVNILAATHVEKGSQWLETLSNENLITIENGSVKLTAYGIKEAEQIIRRHRLTERLFADVFDTPEEVWEREACELEHETVLTCEAVAAVCAFLGHPPTCPHGKPIPRGPCCDELRPELKPFVVPLSEAILAEPYRIVFITPKNRIRLDRLAVLGIIPGSILHIQQKKPTYVIRSGETEVAFDKDIAQGIFVKRM